MYFTTSIAINISFVWFNTIAFYTWDASLQYTISCFPIVLWSFSFNFSKECSKHFFINSAPSKIVTMSLPSIVLLVLIPNLQHDQYEMEIICTSATISAIFICPPPLNAVTVSDCIAHKYMHVYILQSKNCENLHLFLVISQSILHITISQSSNSWNTVICTDHMFCVVYNEIWNNYYITMKWFFTLYDPQKLTQILGYNKMSVFINSNSVSIFTLMFCNTKTGGYISW